MAFSIPLCAVVVVVVAMASASAAVRPSTLHHARAPSDLAARVARKAPQAILHLPTAPRPGLRLRPADFGGDPTGRKDSWASINSCVQGCLNQSSLSPNGHFPGDTSFGDGTFIKDMGGCNVDLDGGEFLISKPIQIPQFNANMQFGRGSIIAAPTFPQNDFLIVVGEPGRNCKYPQGSCNIDINFPELFVDGRHIASGMQINHVMGTTIGPGGYFLNFTQYGVQINEGHEVMMDRVWLGETNFDFDHQRFGRSPNATAIQINGNDHFITNTIVFSSLVGLEVNGAANKVLGVHVWFPLNQALHFDDTRAFRLTSQGNRLTGCYIDGGRAYIEGSAVSHTLWTDGFECCAGGGLGNVPHGIFIVGNSIGPGLQITDCIFGGGSIYHLNSTNNDSVKVAGVRIENNAFSSKAKGTRTTQTMSKAVPSKAWDFDFCDQLLFPFIAQVRLSFVADKGFPQVVARPPQGCKVTVEASEPFSGSVTVDVDSSAPSISFV
eukprot:m.150747 g.150747  ORF g.150747 m.150747 type:complete len:494 (-) comp17391_c0_seq1:77-1558(-)